MFIAGKTLSLGAQRNFLGALTILRSYWLVLYILGLPDGISSKIKKTCLQMQGDVTE